MDSCLQPLPGWSTLLTYFYAAAGILFGNLSWSVSSALRQPVAPQHFQVEVWGYRPVCSYLPAVSPHITLTAPKLPADPSHTSLISEAPLALSLPDRNLLLCSLRPMFTHFSTDWYVSLPSLPLPLFLFLLLFLLHSLTLSFTHTHTHKLQQKHTHYQSWIPGRHTQCISIWLCRSHHSSKPISD